MEQLQPHPLGTGTLWWGPAPEQLPAPQLPAWWVPAGAPSTFVTHDVGFGVTGQAERMPACDPRCGFDGACAAGSATAAGGAVVSSASAGTTSAPAVTGGVLLSTIPTTRWGFDVPMPGTLPQSQLSPVPGFTSPGSAAAVAGSRLLGGSGVGATAAVCFHRAATTSVSAGTAAGGVAVTSVMAATSVGSSPAAIEDGDAAASAGFAASSGPCSAKRAAATCAVSATPPLEPPRDPPTAPRLPVLLGRVGGSTGEGCRSCGGYRTEATGGDSGKKQAGLAPGLVGSDNSGSVGASSSQKGKPGFAGVAGPRSAEARSAAGDTCHGGSLASGMAAEDNGGVAVGDSEGDVAAAVGNAAASLTCSNDLIQKLASTGNVAMGRALALARGPQRSHRR